MAGHDHTPEIHEHADEWHHHTAAEGLPQHEHASIANSGVLIKWFFGMTVLLVIILIALGMYFTRYTTQMREQYVENHKLAETAQMRLAGAEAQLGTDGKDFKYTAVNKQNQSVQRPIQQAMEMTVQKYKQRSPQPEQQPTPAQ